MQNLRPDPRPTESESMFYEDPQGVHLTIKVWEALLKMITSSVQSLSSVWLFATPWTAARQASLSITNSWSSLKLMSIQPSHPLSSPSPPAFSLSQHQGLFVNMFLSYPLHSSHLLLPPCVYKSVLSASPLLPCNRNAFGITFYFILVLSCINTQYYITFSLRHSDPNLCVWHGHGNKTSYSLLPHIAVTILFTILPMCTLYSGDLFTLYLAVCTCESPSLISSALPAPRPLRTTSLFSVSVSLFLFFVVVHIFFLLLPMWIPI